MSATSQRPLRVLLVEDSQDDAELLLRELARGGFTVEHVRVQTDADMRAALAGQPWDLVLSDHSMPEFSGSGALAVLRDSAADIPFIMVSGQIGEETAVEALRGGAWDFLLKGSLARLVPAVERALREARERSERRAAELAAQEALVQRLHAEAANQAKSKFLARMSHELRTPLNAILGFAELLERGVGGDLSTQQRAYVGHVRASGRHLLGLIDEVLDLARIESGQVTLARVRTSLVDLVAEVRAMVAPLAEQAGLRLGSGRTADAWLWADPVRARQILYNLLSNAIKFTPRGGAVSIDGVIAGDMAEIAVRDNGAGIAPEDVPRLFREFERLAPTLAGDVGGTGLGLAVAKTLIDLHGGAIDVDSAPGRGSTFRVRFPLAAEPDAGARPAASPPPDDTPTVGRRARILVVEDDPLSLRLLKAMLDHGGHDAVAARSLEEARAALAGPPPELVVTDLSMPSGGGQALLDEIRANPALRHVPVLVTTAHAMRGDRERLLEAGFDAYLSKPLDLVELERVVEELLRR